MVQRCVELILARRHERIMKKSGAIEIDRSGYMILVLMHIAFLLSFLSEKLLLDRGAPEIWPVLLLFFLGAQLLRYWAISSLGVYWNTKIIVAAHHPKIRTGPYRFLRHPNYIAVAIEITVIPLLFSCYITSIVFSIANALLIGRRIRVETGALKASLE